MDTQKHQNGRTLRGRRLIAPALKLAAITGLAIAVGDYSTASAQVPNYRRVTQVAPAAETPWNTAMADLGRNNASFTLAAPGFFLSALSFPTPAYFSSVLTVTAAPAIQAAVVAAPAVKAPALAAAVPAPVAPGSRPSASLPPTVSVSSGSVGSTVADTGVTPTRPPAASVNAGPTRPGNPNIGPISPPKPPTVKPPLSRQ